MGDHWDPKYPKDLPTWTESYINAWAYIYRQGSPWQPAFSSIVTADAEGKFKEVRAFFAEAWDLWHWRHAVWDLRFIPMFYEPQESWPVYAQQVYAAVPNDWLPISIGLRGIPDAWHDDARKIWAFKSTVLFVTGLIEGTLPATPPDSASRDIRKFVTEQLARIPRPRAAEMAGLDKLINSRVVNIVRSELQPLHEKIERVGNLLTPR